MMNFFVSFNLEFTSYVYADVEACKTPEDIATAA